MKNWLWVLGICFGFWILVLGFAPSGAMGGPAPAKPAAAPIPTAMAGKIFLVDNFESGSLKAPREWWTFDIQKAQIVPNADLKTGEPLDVGNYSLQLAGPAKNWYVGGCGTYLAKMGQDFSQYTNLSLDIYGNGPESGKIKIELVDDDNGNWQAERDPNKAYSLMYDDNWVYEVNVDWTGWKRVSIPISDFVVDNPGAGDGVWNPQQTNGSGGLLQIQMICLANSASGNVNLNVDNVMFTTGEQK